MRLSPIFGIRPGAVILAAIIAFALILAFLLFLLPGIVQKGGYVRFITNTSDTAIWAEDGSYIGSSEGSVYYLPHGTSTFHFSIYGADAGSVTVDIPHRIFFTLFSHKVTDVRHDTENTEEIEKAVRTEFLSEVASWSRVIDYDDRYHFPPLFSSFAKNAVALGFGDISSEMLYGAMHITSAAMEEDFQNALDILSSSSVRYSTPGLEAIAGKRPEPVPSTSIRTVGKPERNGSFFSYPSMAITLGWSDEESFPEANERLVDTAFGAFSIAERPVSEYEYALFTEANPYWSAANKDELIADGISCFKIPLSSRLLPFDNELLHLFIQALLLFSRTQSQHASQFRKQLMHMAQKIIRQLLMIGQNGVDHPGKIKHCRYGIGCIEIVVHCCDKCLPLLDKFLPKGLFLHRYRPLQRIVQPEIQIGKAVIQTLQSRLGLLQYFGAKIDGALIVRRKHEEPNDLIVKLLCDIPHSEKIPQ